MPLVVTLLLCFFSRTLAVFGFSCTHGLSSLRILTTQAGSSMGSILWRALNPYSNWLLSQSLCHYGAGVSCRQVTIVDCWVCSCVNHCLWWFVEYLPVPWTIVSRGEPALGAILYNRALQSVCGEQPIAVAINWVVWGFPWEAICPTTQLDRTFPSTGSLTWWWRVSSLSFVSPFLDDYI